MDLAPLHAATARAVLAQTALRKCEDDLDAAILAAILQKVCELSRRYPKRRITVDEGMGSFSVRIETSLPAWMSGSGYELEAFVATYRGQLEISFDGPRGTREQRKAIFGGIFDIWDMVPDGLDYIPYPLPTNTLTYLNGKEITP